MSDELLRQAEIALAHMVSYQSSGNGPNIHEYGQARRTLDAVRAALSTQPAAPAPAPAPVDFHPGELERMNERGRKAWAGVELVDGHIAEPAPAVRCIDLTHLYRRSTVYSLIAASPHHMTFTVEALRNLIEEYIAPPAPASRVPLTREQIEDLWQRHAGEAWGKTLISPTVFARMIEQYHGIHPASEGGEG